MEYIISKPMWNFFLKQMFRFLSSREQKGVILYLLYEMISEDISKKQFITQQNRATSYSYHSLILHPLSVRVYLLRFHKKSLLYLPHLHFNVTEIHR